MIPAPSLDDLARRIRSRCDTSAVAYVRCAGPNQAMLTLWSMRELRAQNITPLE